MKPIIKLLTIIIIASSASSHLSASNFPTFCENTHYYEDESAFIQVPASIGGCVGNIAGGAAGGTVGLLFGKPKEGAYFTGLIFNAVGNMVFGVPTKITKSVVWDLPKRLTNKE